MNMQEFKEQIRILINVFNLHMEQIINSIKMVVQQDLNHYLELEPLDQGLNSCNNGTQRKELKYLFQIKPGQYIEILLTNVASNGRAIDIINLQIRVLKSLGCQKIQIRQKKNQQLLCMCAHITQLEQILNLNNGKRFLKLLRERVTLYVLIVHIRDLQVEI